MLYNNDNSASVASAIILHTNMRKLCENHSIWIRNVLFCVIDDLPGRQQAIQRLLDNRMEIGNAVKPYYGNYMGKMLSEYLRIHINLTIEIAEAAKAKDTDLLFLLDKKWYDNADEFSIFLSKINPVLSLKNMKALIDHYLKLTHTEIMLRARADYSEEADAFELMRNQILKISDFVTDGISAQFPKKFKTDYAKHSRYVFGNFF